MRGEDGVLVLELVAGQIVSHGVPYPGPMTTWSERGAQGLDGRYVRAQLPSAYAVPFNAFTLEGDFRSLADDPAIRTVTAWSRG